MVKLNDANKKYKDGQYISKCMHNGEMIMDETIPYIEQKVSFLLAYEPYMIP